MSLISLSNDKLLLEISPEMGASITKFKNLKSGKDIFRPFPNKKKIIRKNCYFAGYFATVPYFGEIKKQLSLMEKENIIEHKQSSTDIKLYWKLPREDDYTLNPLLKKTKAHYKSKANKIKFMLDYAFQ